MPAIVMRRITTGECARRERKAAAMIAVDLRIPTTSREYSTIATITVRDGEAAFTGRRDLFDPELIVFDETAGERVLFDDDPERWARNLDSAFRTGQLVAVITADSKPAPPRARSRRPDVSIPTR